jgi:hypothetical protein
MISLLSMIFMLGSIQIIPLASPDASYTGTAAIPSDPIGPGIGFHDSLAASNEIPFSLASKAIASAASRSGWSINLSIIGFRHGQDPPLGIESRDQG